MNDTYAASFAVLGTVLTSFAVAAAVSSEARWRKILGFVAAAALGAVAIYGWSLLWTT